MKNNFKNQNLLLISIHRKSLLKGYQESIEKLISKQILKNFDLGKTILKRKNIAVWGLVNTKENFKIWKNIQKSDVIMFLRDKKFFSKGIVVDTKEDNNISKKIWKDISFLEKRNLMIFLEKIEPIELEFDVCVPTLIEPNIPNAYFFPIKKIDDKKKNLLIETFGNIENAINFLIDPERKISDYLTQEELSEEIPITIKPSSGKQRIGQQKFRKNILVNFGYKCVVCGISDVDLLEASHIIPVVDKILSGKINNGICLCSNCHKMFDNGFFSFNEKYEVIISRRKKISNITLEVLKNRKIGKCKILPSKKYFGLHRAKFGIKG